MSAPRALRLYAGARALAQLRRHGALRPAQVGTIAAAAGGPKGLKLWLIKMMACQRLTRTSACPRRSRSPVIPGGGKLPLPMPTHCDKGLKLNNASMTLASRASEEKTPR